MMIYLMILALQVALLVLIAGGLHILYRHRPSVQHFVWLTTILAIGLAIPLQSQMPSLDMQIPVAASSTPTIESNRSLEGLDFPNVVETSEVLSNDVAMVSNTIPDSASEDVSSSQASVASLISRMTAWRWMALGYLVVCFALVLRLLSGVFALNRLKASAREANHSLGGAENAIKAVAQRICSRRKVQVLLSDEVQVPMAFGLWRPTVLLPQSFSSWPEEAQHAVLLHEFSHVQRFDAFWDLVTRMVAIAWWFHPAIHYAIQRLCQTRERATDEMVLEHGVSPAVYAKQLLEVASQSTRMRRRLALYMSCQGDIKHRIEAILESGPSFRKKSWKFKFAVVAGFLVLASASIRVSFATTSVPIQEKENVAESKKEPTKPEDVTGRTFYERVQQVTPKERKPTGRTISISGRITDENGNPVPDAIVILRDASTYSAEGDRTINDVLAKTVSDVNGRYSFDQLVVPVDFRYGPVPQLLCVSKTKMGLSHFQYKPDSSGSFGDVDIKITDTVSVKGTVIDPDGNPVADTRVSFTHLSEPGDRYAPQSHFGDRLIKPESKTDQQGRFELPGMPSGYVVGLQLRHVDYAPTFETMRSSADHRPFVKYHNGRVAVADNGATISLNKGVELSGAIVDGDGKPISGVSVSTQWRKCSTDLMGRFSFLGRESAAESEITLFVRQSKGFTRLLRVKQSELEAGTANLRILKPGKVKGKIISAETGRPIEGMSVWLDPQGDDMGQLASADGNGVFEEQVAPGEIDVTLSRGSARVGIYNATADECEFRNRPVSVGDFSVGTLKIKPGETRELTIRVSVEGSSRVKVLDQNGSPVENAMVGYLSRAGGTEGFVKTDADGMARVDPPFGTMIPRRLFAKFDDGGKIQFAELDGPGPAHLPGKVLEMKLRPSILVSGTVSVKSQPIENAMIQIRRPNDSNPAYTVATVVTDKRGFYSAQVPRGSMKGRLPGYRVQVTSHKIPNSKISFAVNKAKLVDGQLKADVDLIKGGGKIEGVVVDSKGEPVADSLVEVQHLMMRNPERKEIQPSQLFESTSQFTDSEGRFEFTGLPEGFETIIVAGVKSTRRGASVVAVGNQAAKVLVTDVGEQSKVRISLF